MKPTRSSVNEVKNNNTNLIKEALKTVDYGTKSTISILTGLSVSTCNTILNELAASGEAFEVSGEIPSSGRPPKAYLFNADYSHICCLYLTNENFHKLIHYSIVNLMGNIVTSDCAEKDYIDAPVILDELAGILEKDQLIDTISLGFSGYPLNGLIASSGIHELFDCPLKQLIIDRFHMRTIWGNDMNAIALGLFEEMYPESRDPFCVIGLFVGRCPGVGIIVDGKIVRGATGFAGEVMHLNANSEEFWSTVNEHYEETVQKTANIICSIATIINPKTMVLTGENTSNDMIPDLITECYKTIQPVHMPELIYVKSIEKYYVKGLFLKTIQEN